MAPAAIGSERKRHVPMPNMVVPQDWSSVSKRNVYINLFLLNFFRFLLEPYPVDPYLPQQQVPLSNEYPPQPTRDYPR